MNTLPLWRLASLAAESAPPGTTCDGVRVHCIYWTCTEYGESEDDAELAELAIRTVVSTLLASPIQPADSTVAIEANITLAVAILDWTCRSNGREYRRSDLVTLCRNLAGRVQASNSSVADVIHDAVQLLQQLTFDSVLPFVFECDDPQLGLPERPTVYLASALTGFRDVAPEWLWSRDVEIAPGAQRDSDGAWSDHREHRRRLGLDFQRSINDSVAATLRAAGISVFVPHEQFDPDRNTDETPQAVDLGDRLGVAGADVLVVLADYPALGAGKEIVLAESALQATVIVSSLDVRTSRLISGTSHFKRETVAHWLEWPKTVTEQVLQDLYRHERHAAVRKHNLASSAALLATLDVIDSTDGLLTTERAIQLASNPELLASASFFEIQELLRAAGLRLTLSADRVPMNPDAPPFLHDADVAVVADSFIRAKNGLSLESPNSAAALLRAIGVNGWIEDRDLAADAQTRRLRGGELEIRVKPTWPRRDRFSVAHEVAHVILEGDALTVSHRKGPDENSRELEHLANELAGHLLMPTIWLQEEVRRIEAAGQLIATVEHVQRMAARANVAPDALAMRLTMLRPDRPVVWLTMRFEQDRWRTQHYAGMPRKWMRNGPPQVVGIGPPGPTPNNGPVGVVLQLMSGERIECLADCTITARGECTAVLSALETN